MQLQQDYLFWKIAHYVAVDHHFRILKVNERQGEVWLEPVDRQHYQLVRLKRDDIDWGNWIRQDATRTYSTLDQLRKPLRKKRLHGLNVYVSTFEPVDDWKYLLQELKEFEPDGQVKMDTVLIDSERAKEQVAALFNQMNVPLPQELTDWFTDIDEEEVKRLIFSLKQAAEEQIQEEQKLFTFGKPYITYFLIAANVLMFLIMELNGGSTNTQTLIQFGAKVNPLIIGGEWWRFITPIFLHIGFLHLFMNTLALYYLGTAVERIYGSTRFFLIYFIAGLIGSFASFALNDEISAGASGAIFGCFGALLYFGLIHRDLFFRTIGMNVIVVLIINLVFGFSVSMVDNGAHIGGLIGGFLASSIVHLPHHKKRVRQALFFALTITGVMVLLYFGYSNQSSGDPLLSAQIAQQMIEEGNEQEAKRLLLKAIGDSDDAPAEAYFLLSYVEIKDKEFDQAIEHLLITIKKNPDFHQAHYNLSLVYIELGEYQKARESIQRAVELDPENEQYQEVLTEITGE